MDAPSSGQASAGDDVEELRQAKAALSGDVARLQRELALARAELRELRGAADAQDSDAREQLQSAASAIDAGEARIRAFFEAIVEPIFIWRVAPGNRLVHEAYNPAAEATTGFTNQQARGRAPEEFLAPPIAAAIGSAMQECLASGGTVHKVFEFDFGSAGHAAVWDTLFVPVRDAGTRRITHIVGAARDISEQRALQSQLAQSQKMEAIGQLTGGIAHDFNNLLQGIMGNLELAQGRVAAGRPEGIGRYVGGAINAARRAASLTQRLLAFARRQTLDPRPVNVNQLVAGLEDMIRRTLEPSIQLEVVLAGGVWTTCCDVNQLENALLNACINARDAMPEGGRLTIETGNAFLDEAYARSQRDVAPGQYVSLSVTDTGTGMSRDTIDRAFDPFFTTKPIGQGTGLGLSMLYGFVKQSEGHARIYSEEGRGTTLRIYLPRHRGEIGEEGTVETLPERPGAGIGETVLVVEDDPAVRALVLEVLEELGCAALEAGEAMSGLRLLARAVRVDLLITDVGLPGMNGRQLADAARHQRPDLPVLFITGFASNALIGNGLLDPGMEVLTKPFALDALARKVRSLLDRQPRAEA